MNRNWTDFKSIYSNIAGAREAFEDACETLFKKIYEGKHVSQVKVRQGDGGIDIFVGELGIEPITVIQCKFFLEAFEESQHSQIRSSFETAIKSDMYELKEWILCIPKVIDIDENTWWFRWKHKQIKKHSKQEDFIKLKNGNELIDLLKEHNLYNLIFKIEDSIKIDELHKLFVPKKVNSHINKKVSDILFNNYSLKCEPFYLQRNIDIEFIKALEFCNVWLFGESGFGKTALINRNLLKNSLDYCICDLSPIKVTEKDDVLNEILLNLEEKFECNRDAKETNILKQICKILSAKASNRTIIVIDELSVSNITILKDIAESFIQLVVHFNNQVSDDELRFVVSTILDPKKIIENKSKASQQFQYMSCDDWDKYLPQLFDIVSKSLSMDLADSRDNIIRSAGDSPRVMKNIFRKIIVFGDISRDEVDKAIKLTIEEIVN